MKPKVSDKAVKIAANAADTIYPIALDLYGVNVCSGWFNINDWPDAPITFRLTVHRNGWSYMHDFEEHKILAINDSITIAEIYLSVLTSKLLDFKLEGLRHEDNN